MKRAALGAFLAALALLLVGPAPAALAHTELILSDPADGAVLAAPPQQVVLTFSEELIADTVRVSISDATGLAVLVADASVDGDTVTATWPPGLTGNAFDVNYRVVSQDGHPVSGTVAFSTTASSSAAPSVSAPAAATLPAQTAPMSSPTSDPAATEPSGISPLSMVSVGLAIGIAIGVAFWAGRRRRSA